MPRRLIFLFQDTDHIFVMLMGKMLDPKAPQEQGIHCTIGPLPLHRNGIDKILSNEKSCDCTTKSVLYGVNRGGINSKTDDFLFQDADHVFDILMGKMFDPKAPQEQGIHCTIGPLPLHRNVLGKILSNEQFCDCTTKSGLYGVNRGGINSKADDFLFQDADHVFDILMGKMLDPKAPQEQGIHCTIGPLPLHRSVLGKILSNENFVTV